LAAFAGEGQAGHGRQPPVIYMIKKERSKKEKLIQNPLSFYVTNVGFIGNQPRPKQRSVNKKS
jgi:hypothetical protein